jgi:hypothetical protein
MNSGSKKNFRVGQRVQSAEDVSRVFVIRKSQIPARIFFGANRWWTKNELQAIGAAENPVTSHRLSGIGNAFQMRSNAYKCVTSEPQVAPEGPEERNCPFCRASFRMKRNWQKFCSAKCKVAYWKQRREGAVNQDRAANELATAVVMIQ